MSEMLAVLLAVLALLAGGYVLVPAVLRRLPARPPRWRREPIPAAWYGMLERCVPLARGLSAAERERLLRLTQVFLAEKHIEGCGGLRLTEEMTFALAAEACLLLLHLDGPCYPGLRTVLVYPGAFVPRVVPDAGGGRLVRQPGPLMGESWRGGVVVLSWDDVARGARDAEHATNVVLHEFAHQLDYEDGAADGTPLMAGGALRAWARVLGAEFEHLRREAAALRPSVLDPYGASNKGEFFAVATEAFFERPLALERERPELYAELRALYRQDPARRVPPLSPPEPRPAG